MRSVGRAVMVVSAGLALCSPAIRHVCASEIARVHLNLPPKVTQEVGPGLHKLGGRDGSLYVPAGYKPGKRLPLLVLLHGGLGSGADWFRKDQQGPLGQFAAHADRDNFVILAPNSGGMTWGNPPKDFAFDYIPIVHAIEHAFSSCSLDPNRIAIGGFSDGASYAMSVGLANGDIFRYVITFSPGYLIGAPAGARPPIYMAHGVADRVCPITQTTRPFASDFKKNGYPVTVREFPGGHGLPPYVADEALNWLAARFRS